MNRRRLLGILITTAALVSVFIAAAGTADVKVQIKEWDVPTASSRPHDPAVENWGHIPFF